MAVVDIKNLEGKSVGQIDLPDDVFRAKVNPNLLAYQYLQALPQIAQGNASTIWMLPSELTDALGQIAGRVRKDPAGSPPEAT